MSRSVALAALVALGLAVVLGGAAPFGRLALSLGLPRLAAALSADPEWRGAALYRAGRFDAAAEALLQAPPGVAYNRATALARAGRYAEALEGYDAALAQNRLDAEARANFDLVAQVYAGTELIPEATVNWWEQREGETYAAPLGKGSGRAASTGDASTNAGALIGLPEIEGRGPLNVRRVFDARYIRASPLWLETLADVPGEYLAARIAAEHKRRAAAGLSPPDPEDPR